MYFIHRYTARQKEFDKFNLKYIQNNADSFHLQLVQDNNTREEKNQYLRYQCQYTVSTTATDIACHIDCLL